MNVFDIVKSKENSMAKLNIKIDTLVHAPLDYVW